MRKGTKQEAAAAGQGNTADQDASMMNENSEINSTVH